VLGRDRYRCRWCGSTVRICAHHVRETSRYPELALDPENGLTLCADCHFYHAHHGWPAWVHGRYSRSRRPFPGQLDLFAAWTGPLFSVVQKTHVPPPIGSTWPGPQHLLFALETGHFAAVGS
jgi:hypothetical protein